MKNRILFSLTAALSLTVASGVNAGPVGWGISLFGGAETVAKHNLACNAKPPVLCPETNSIVTIWLDPGLIAATALDLLATKKQDERTIDCQDALDELEASLGSGCSGGGSSGKDTSLSADDSVVVAPDDITNVLNMEVHEKEDLFDSVRYAVENYLFYSDDCKEDCVLERQNTWLLTSVTMAAAAGDKLLASTKGGDPMAAEYAALVSDFNGQTSPMGLWGSSSKITLHTHVQQNDINALYARDLEMNALNGVRESEDVRLIK